MNRRLPFTLSLLLLLPGFRFPANARIVCREVNRSILAAHDYSHDTDGTIETWKQERSDLPDRTWHFGYDAANRLTSTILKNPAETILKTHGWQYDPGNNRIATQTDADGLIPAAHNKLNQLLTHGSDPLRFSGTLDEPGTVTINGEDARMRNQTLFEAYLELPPGTHEIEIEATDFSENTTTQSFEVEIADEPETALEYDLNGNLTTRTNASGITTYEWDALDRLITIIYPDTSRSEFTYDGLSRRVRIIEKDATSTSTVTSDKRHLWDDLQIAEERAANGSTVSKRFYPQGIELTTGPNAGTYTYRTDHLGSIREVVDDTGSLSARYDYTAWGETELVSGSFDLDCRYAGHYYHQPSGLHLAPFRAYDAKLARWISRDPIEEEGGVNLYSYVGNDAVNEWDPFGLLAWSNWHSVVDPSIGANRDFACRANTFEQTASIASIGIAGAAIGGAAIAGPATAYHFTSATAYASIMSNGGITAGSGLFGRGVYVSAVNSAFLAKIMGAQSTEKCIKVATEGLKKSAMA